MNPRSIVALLLLLLPLARLAAAPPTAESANRSQTRVDQENSGQWVSMIGVDGPTGIAKVGENLTVCGDVQLSPDSRKLAAVPGNGVVAALSKFSYGGANNLLSKQSFGDCEVQLEFLIGRDCNSGVKLQQRYEIQLFDSHGKEKPSATECGGIYPHWLFQGEGKGLKYIDDGVPPMPNAGLGIEEYNRQGIPVSEILISSVLQDAGYFTGAIGKWHLGIDPQFHPNQRGFNDFYGFLGGGHDYFPETYAATYARQLKARKTVFNDYILPLEHNGKQVEETEYMTDALSREGMRFVNEASKKDAPFFLYLSYNAPHTPLQAKEDDLAKYAHIKDEKRRTYAAMVDAVDRGVGQVVNALEQTGEMDNTLIVFLSDNGGKEGAGSDNKPLKKGKGSVYEGGFRVPMFFHWPNQVPAGERSVKISGRHAALENAGRFTILRRT